MQVIRQIILPLTDVIAIDSDWLPLFVPNMCTFSKPLDDPAPSYDHTTGTIKCHMAATYGKHMVIMGCYCYHCVVCEGGEVTLTQLF